MKMLKGVVVVAAILAMLVSVGPLTAKDPLHDDTGGGSGSGGGSWDVTCNYDGGHTLLSKTCSSGGNEACSCP